MGSTYVSIPHSEEGHYSSLTYEEKQKKIPCECEDELDEMENGVKFNPFYVREMHQTTSKSGNQPSPPLNRINSSGLCQVLMDSVMHTSHVAAIHAEQTDCFQCREYMHKFRTGITDLGDHAQKLDHDEPRNYYDMQVSTIAPQFQFGLKTKRDKGDYLILIFSVKWRAVLEQENIIFGAQSLF